MSFDSANAEGIGRQATREEFAAGLAIVTAAYSNYSGNMPEAELRDIIKRFSDELWSGDQSAATMPACFVAMRIATMLAVHLGLPDLRPVFAEVGREIALLPESPERPLTEP